MNNKHTLKELADIGLNAACQFEPNSKFPLSFQNYREAFTKAILDAIGYEFPKDAEREAFDAWCNANHKLATTDQFEAWKAGREELRKEVCSDQCENNPAWIPWGGGECPISDNVKRWQYKNRDGFIMEHPSYKPKDYNWKFREKYDDIIAYRILDSDQSKDTKTEPDWIPWSGGDKSPIVGEQRYEVKYRDGVMHTYTQNNVLCWRHSGTCADIIAYRILKP